MESKVLVAPNDIRWAVGQERDDAISAWTRLHRELVHQEYDEELERSQQQAEVRSESDLAASGKCLPKVLACDQSIGLFGRTIVEFRHTSTAAGAETPLPPHKFRDGDLVSIREVQPDVDDRNGITGRKSRKGDATGAGQLVATGLVARCTDLSIQVAFDDDDDDDGAALGPVSKPSGKTSKTSGRKRQGVSSSASIFHGSKYRLDTLSNDVTMRRCDAALSALSGNKWLEAEPMISLMFGHHGTDGAPAPSVSSAVLASPAATFIPLRQTLNPSQRRAVAAGITSQDMILIHGPPGTGKTSTLVELIAQLVARGLRVLACAPSNVAVDNLAERLAALPALPALPQAGDAGAGAEPGGTSSLGVDMELESRPSGSAAPHGSAFVGSRQPVLLRVGHPARVSESTQSLTLDAMLEKADSAEVLRDARRDLRDARRRALGLDKKKKRPADNRQESGPMRRSWGGSRREAWDDVKRLRKEIREREREASRAAVMAADVVLCTMTGAASGVVLDAIGHPASRRARWLAKQRARAGAGGGAGAATGAGGGDGSVVGAAVGRQSVVAAEAVPQEHPMPFDVVVLDEAAQATEVACWIPLLLGKRGILAGDHKQLPPTITSPAAEKAGLGITLVDRFDRRWSGHEGAVCLLDTQYRMHRHISDWSSRAMYEGRL